jgi:hypothetical protein
MAKIVSDPTFLDLEHPATMRAIIQHILDHGHIEGCDPSGVPIMTFSFPAEPWLISKLAAFGAALEDLEPDEDLEPEEDIDEPPPVDRVA